MITKDKNLIYDLKTEYCGTIPVVLVKEKYQANSSLAVEIIINKTNIKKDYYEGESWNTLTVCLPGTPLSNPRCAYVDTNNNSKLTLEMLEYYNIAKPTGNIGFSGFCRYPEYEFDLTKLLEIKEK